jgi:hypothetical protein
MSKSILTFSASAILMSALITGCSTPAEKAADAQEKVADANKDLDKANKDYLADMESYKKETVARIASNDSIIADFKARIALDKADAKAEYDKQIALLEAKNSEMKQKMADYKSESKEKWETFKTEFTMSMDELAKSFKDLKNKKGS